MTAEEFRGLIDAAPTCIVIPRDLAEEFHAMLVERETRGKITWVNDPAYGNTTDHNAMLDGCVVGWVWKNIDGSWYGNHVYSPSSDGANFPTEEEARAAVEAAVRAGL